MRIIIYSHGFGVYKDDRGLFSDIAAALPDSRHVMFDYNQVDEATGNLVVTSLGEQAKKLRQVIAETKQQNPNATIDLVCHSQGCVVACLARPEGLRKIILTGPPAILTVERMVELFKNRPGSEVNLAGTSLLKRADFSATEVPPEYWKSIEHLDPIALYNDLPKTAQLIVVNATEDEIIGSRDFSRLSPAIQVVEIKTGHNFEGEGRQKLIDVISRE
jgi:hypothetical protein